MNKALTKSKIKWILEPLQNADAFDRQLTSNINLFKDCIVSNDYECDFINYNRDEFIHDYLDKDVNYIFNGSVNFARQLQRDTEVNIFLSYPNYNYLTALDMFEDKMFNSEPLILKVKDIEVSKILNGLYNPDKFHLRPDSGFKIVNSGVYDIHQFESMWSWYSMLVNPEEKLLFNRLKGIKSEYRFTCLNNKILSKCQYEDNGEFSLDNNVPDDVIKYAQSIIDIGWYPDPVYILDICRSTDDKLYIMEFNSFSCAGLYCSNVEELNKIVIEVSKFIERNSK